MLKDLRAEIVTFACLIETIGEDKRIDAKEREISIYSIFNKFASTVSAWSFIYDTRDILYGWMLFDALLDPNTHTHKIVTRLKYDNHQTHQSFLYIRWTRVFSNK